MKPIERVAVIGLGLMGGSLARAIGRRNARVLGYDSDLESLDAAESEVIVHERLGAELEGIENADVVVFAIPVDEVVALLPCVVPRIAQARLVMDVASTKRSIIGAAEEAGIGERYVGAHPLTGSHRSGWRASRANLFDDARVFLCPTRFTTPAALKLAEAFWRGLHSRVELLDAATHDVQMAWRSHLPHVMSVALALTLREAGVGRSALGPGGRDVTRLAGSSPALWTSIVADNGDAIADALEAMERQLHRFRMALARGDDTATQTLLESACEWYDGTAPGPVTIREVTIREDLPIIS